MRLWPLSLILCCATAFALLTFSQESFGENAPEVDQAEVIRRGDMVVVCGEGPRSSGEEAQRQATAPPEDDSDQWYITVIKQSGCPPCEKLLSDFQRSAYLTAFVAANEGSRPWAHFNIYNKDDATQKWRIEQYRISAYPTIVIQPPRNGTWGPPGTVVWQKTGYSGNPEALSKEISAAVRKYAEEMSKKGYPRPNQPVRELPENPTQGARAEDGVKEIGQPFPSPPRPDPFNPIPNQSWPPPSPSVSPQENGDPGVEAIVGLVRGVVGLASGGTTTNLFLLALVAMRFYSVYIAPKTPSTLDDKVVSFLSSVLDRSNQVPPSTPTNTPDPTNPINLAREIVSQARRR